MSKSTIKRTSRSATVAAAAAVLTFSTFGITSAQAAPEPGVSATFEGRTISLGQSWEEARSCVVLGPSKVKCYRSSAQADRALTAAGLAEPEPAAASRSVTAMALPACADGWLCLYEDINGGGKRLIFQDEYWQHLGDYGFANTVTSYRNRQSDGGGNLADFGSPIYFPISANAYNSFIGDWNDRADDVHP